MNGYFATAPTLAPTPARLMLIGGMDDGSNSLVKTLEAAGHTPVQHRLSPPFSSAMRNLFPTLDLILIDITRSGRDCLPFIKQLNAFLGMSSLRPRILCFATEHRNPQFVLAVQKCGAQYVRVSDHSLLLEAIDLTLSQMRELERAGPSFTIVHSYSLSPRGAACDASWCAPGEECTSVILQADQSFQLRLGLAQRLLFDFLANHRRLALDSHQIASGLAGEFFYREHAGNSGHMQLKKIRTATVKVLVQRIREAMASSFAAAHLRFDSCDVLRSCPAEGSRRVLYKLCADVNWLHVNSHSR